MCILFIYNGSDDKDSDYTLVLATNRDEYYDRPTQNFAPWIDDPSVFGGRDLESGRGGGTWLAIAPQRKKIGILLNLPSDVSKSNAKSRGKVVADFVKTDNDINEYVEKLRPYAKETSDFLFIGVEFGQRSLIHSYDNVTDKLQTWTNPCQGFGNSLPDIPLKKVEAGKMKLQDICSRFNKISMKQQLIEELIELLKSDEKHLPDPELKRRRPTMYQQLSSIYVSVSEGRYGSRTHTLILITKSGHVDVIETSLQAPIDLNKPNWLTTEFQFDVNVI